MRDEILTDAVSVLCMACSASPVLLTGTTVKTEMARVTIPGGLMGPNGRLRVELLATRTNNANAITLTAEIGGVVLGTYNVVNQSGYRLMLIMHNQNSEIAQVRPSGNAAFGPNAQGPMATSAIDTTQPFDLTFSGTLANAGDSLTLEAYTVEVIRG